MAIKVKIKKNTKNTFQGEVAFNKCSCFIKIINRDKEFHVTQLKCNDDCSRKYYKLINQCIQDWIKSEGIYVMLKLTGEIEQEKLINNSCAKLLLKKNTFEE